MSIRIHSFSFVSLFWLRGERIQPPNPSQNRVVKIKNKKKKQKPKKNPTKFPCLLEGCAAVC